MDVLAAPILPTSVIGSDPASLVNPLNSAKGRSVDDVARDFEGMFMSIMLKQMRETLEPGSFFGSDSADVYGGLFDLYMGQHLAQAGGLGLGAVLKQQLSREGA